MAPRRATHRVRARRYAEHRHHRDRHRHRRRTGAGRERCGRTRPCVLAGWRALYYASAETGDLEIYRLDLATQQKSRVTDARGLDLRPQPLANGAVVFVSKRGSGDEVAVVDADGTRRVLALASIASLARPAVSSDGRRVAVPLPVLSSTAWALQVIDVSGGPLTEIVSGGGHPVMPAWSPDGREVFFARADGHGVFGLWRIAAGGGVARPIVPTAWDWKAPTAKLRREHADSGGRWPPQHASESSARTGIRRSRIGISRGSTGRTGAVFTYSSGVLEFEVPAGEYESTSKQPAASNICQRGGHATPAPGSSAGVTLRSRGRAWTCDGGLVSGDHHFHLNYGGQVLLAPDALVPMMRGEDLDVATPLSANLHTRRIDEGYFAWTRREPPLIQFGQEVRSHFLGHTGHIGINSCTGRGTGARAIRCTDWTIAPTWGAAADARAGRCEFVRASRHRARAVWRRGAERNPAGTRI